ncbi:SigE family RNA polymerase sigma factor [Cryptosporangium aurantiacum]|uniref:RNA polymerase sigma-70 factor, sigma-E family n=1 Tax=Cryptosporangium aurantiacum TaxID=134849 RepID=A0A1M7RNJ2_9ACTN|nr:SigE family RNA polymerase sigma factor [Cryptosporangium aurantiacum]SHN47720.1 RNA polymerase sigma-70 factor, sigma-E family [Cryptosporangium aurantiacum]
MDALAQAAFRDFVSDRTSALLRTAYLLTGDRGQAEDLLQTALVKTYVSWNHIRDKAALDSYVRRVMATTAVSWWRRRWHAERPSGDLPEPRQDDDPASDHAERDAMWRLLRRLSPKQRAVLVLRFYEDWSEAQIAEALGMSAGSVKSHASRGLAAMRAQLDVSEPTREGRR